MKIKVIIKDKTSDVSLRKLSNVAGNEIKKSFKTAQRPRRGGAHCHLKPVKCM